jgi:hypothetical protein
VVFVHVPRQVLEWYYLPLQLYCLFTIDLPLAVVPISYAVDKDLINKPEPIRPTVKDRSSDCAATGIGSSIFSSSICQLVDGRCLIYMYIACAVLWKCAVRITWIAWHSVARFLSAVHVKWVPVNMAWRVLRNGLRRVAVNIPVGARNFSLHRRVQNGSGAHPTTYPMGTRGSFPGGKAAGEWSW